ncbi:hypothetical protein TNCV_4409721 [Trichonephila clavipes]|nr:hypothetical protein TNCV_4409721 [Trichonephila clavipes]
MPISRGDWTRQNRFRLRVLELSSGFMPRNGLWQKPVLQWRSRFSRAIASYHRSLCLNASDGLFAWCCCI